LANSSITFTTVTPAPQGGAERFDLDGGGGGLGLASVRGIVVAHRGEVAVGNADAGCRFVVRLPVPA
jgi:signal transduction histidine kinase